MVLGDYTKVEITHRIGSVDKKTGYKMPLNFGRVSDSSDGMPAFVMGIHYPIKNFSGRIIAVLQKGEGAAEGEDAGEIMYAYAAALGPEEAEEAEEGQKVMVPAYLCDSEQILVLASKNSRYIINEIAAALDYARCFREYRLVCLYESSAGAVVYHEFEGKAKFLVIKNRRSMSWGFPKGHIEKGEKKEETALREVYEETGLRVELLPEFERVSKYKIQNTIEKNVYMFAAAVKEPEVKAQREEVCDYEWLTYEKALQRLKFDNDRKVLFSAYRFLGRNEYIH